MILLLMHDYGYIFFPLYPLVEKRDLVKSLDITTLNTEDIGHAVIDSRRI